MRFPLSPLMAVTVMVSAISCSSKANDLSENEFSQKEEVVYLGKPSSSIASAVIVPADKKYYWSSGSTGPMVDSTATEGARERFGDTKTQSIGILTRFKETLAESGLSLKDVTYLRVYITPDRATGEIDFKGWYEAYALFFGTEENPVKPSRSTIGIAGLAHPDKFIEIELVAVYP